MSVFFNQSPFSLKDLLMLRLNLLHLDGRLVCVCICVCASQACLLAQLELLNQGNLRLSGGKRESLCVLCVCVCMYI